MSVTIDLTGVPLIEVAQDLYRNVVSLRTSEHLFDDLSDDPLDMQAAVMAEIAAKPPEYQSSTGRSRKRSTCP